MRIVFTLEAKADLDELRAWLSPLSPAALRRVAASIERSVRAIAENPEIGRSTPREGVRSHIEPRYGFEIPYLVRDDSLFVLRVHRTVRKPLDYTKLQEP